MRIGPYEVLSALGAGGMGEVYRARDRKLDRDVALKVLPDAVAADPERLARFEREAKLLAALNHPNIAHIYGVEDSSTTHALVMELVDGPTLADRIAQGPLPVREALAIARQIAEAVEAAHEQGIIHRDLKPANIKVRHDGAVKVLDFGLAKILARKEATVAAEAPTLTALNTRGEVRLGTPAYMSPEQARGRPVDKRTDIWAFGCVVYEMLSGRRTFAGETVSDTIAAILERPPDWHPLPVSTPAGVRRLLRRCLEKDQTRRLHDIVDARIEIEDAASGADDSRAEGPSGIQLQAAPTNRAERGGRRVALTAAMVLLTVITVGLVVGRSRLLPTRSRPTDPLLLLRLTSDSGLSMDPSISPDGKLVAYASDRAGDGNLDIWVQQVDGSGAPLRLTSDPADESEPSFSPDGNQIVFRSKREGGGIYIIATLGGDTRLVAPAGREPRFSPDGTQIAYVTGAGDLGGGARGPLFVVPSKGGVPVQVTSRAARSPVWSPDGKFILFATGAYRPDDWAIVPTDQGANATVTALPLTEFKRIDLFDAVPCEWLPDNRILFSAGAGDVSQLFEIGLHGTASTSRLESSPVPVTFGTAMDEHASAAGTSAFKRVAFASLARGEHIWSLAFDTNHPESVGKLTQLTQESGNQIFPSISRDGTRVAYLSHSARNDEVWLLNPGTGKRLLLSTEASVKFKPIIHADGSRIAYEDHPRQDRSSSGPSSLRVVSSSGGAPETLCDNCGWPWDWSADHARILLFSHPHKTVAAGELDATTRNIRVRLEKDGADLYSFHWSPDGKWVAFQVEYPDSPEFRQNQLCIAAIDAEDNVSSDWITVDTAPSQGGTGWSPDGRWLYSRSGRDGFICLWAYPLDSVTKRPIGKPVAVYHSHELRLSLGNANQVSQEFSVAVDKIVFNQGEVAGNIWLTTLADH